MALLVPLLINKQWNQRHWNIFNLKVVLEELVFCFVNLKRAVVLQSNITRWNCRSLAVKIVRIMVRLVLLLPKRMKCIGPKQRIPVIPIQVKYYQQLLMLMARVGWGETLLIFSLKRMDLLVGARDL